MEAGPGLLNFLRPDPWHLLDPALCLPFALSFGLHPDWLNHDDRANWRALINVVYVWNYAANIRLTGLEHILNLTAGCRAHSFSAASGAIWMPVQGSLVVHIGSAGRPAI